MGGFASALSLGQRLFDAWTGPTGTGLTAWFLAAVFAISGIAKLRRPTLAAMAIVDFGVVRRARPELGLGLGLGELALAVALPIVPMPAGVIAAVVLWLFAGLIARAILSGAAFPCFCFGETDQVVSRSTLVRTTALALIATLVAWGAWAGNVGIADESLLQVTVAGAVLGLIVLGSRVPEPLRWNSDPFGLETEEAEA